MSDEMDLVKMLRGYYNCGYYKQEDLDRAADALEQAQVENNCLQNTRDAMEWIRTDTAHKAPEQITVGLLVTYIAKLEGALKPAGNSGNG